MRTSAGLCNFSCSRGRRVPFKLVRSLIKGRLGTFSPDSYLFSNVYKGSPPPSVCPGRIWGWPGNEVFSSSFEANGKADTFSPVYNYILHSIFHLFEGKLLNFIGVCVGMCYRGVHMEARGQHAVVSFLLPSSEAWEWNSGFLEART